MPGWAGSSWYFLRYMDAHNDAEFAGESTVAYWNQVDLYVGGSEHATGHLLYSRFWTKALYDLGHINFDEPFKKLINQGMIQGISAFVHRINGTNTFVSSGLKDQYETHPLHADVSFLQGDELNVEAFRNWREEYKSAEFILEEGKYICSREVEKMSKSKFNVTNPDDIVVKYGADVLRMYEMFLGPIEQSKPWNTQGLSGVAGFQRKFWKLFHMDGTFAVSDAPADKKALKAAHTCIKKVGEDIENFSFNTSVSAFMIATNELTELKANNREVLEPLVRLIAPFAPHLAEELWEKLGGTGSVTHATYPQHDESYLIESSKNYPVSFNGKMRFKITLSADASKDEIEKAVMAHDKTVEQLKGAAPKRSLWYPVKLSISLFNNFIL